MNVLRSGSMLVATAMSLMLARALPAQMGLAVGTKAPNAAVLTLDGRLLGIRLRSVITQGGLNDVRTVGSVKCRVESCTINCVAWLSAT